MNNKREYQRYFEEEEEERFRNQRYSSKRVRLQDDRDNRPEPHRFYPHEDEEHHNYGDRYNRYDEYGGRSNDIRVKEENEPENYVKQEHFNQYDRNYRIDFVNLYDQEVPNHNGMIARNASIRSHNMRLVGKPIEMHREIYSNLSEPRKETISPFVRKWTLDALDRLSRTDNEVPFYVSTLASYLRRLFKRKPKVFPLHSLRLDLEG